MMFTWEKTEMKRKNDNFFICKNCNNNKDLMLLFIVIFSIYYSFMTYTIKYTNKKLHMFLYSV